MKRNMKELAVVFLVLSMGIGVAVVAVAKEAPMAPEKNPPGDIPDNQVFVKYTGAGYELEIPEGWARTVQGTDVRFVYRFDGVSVALTRAVSPPDADSIRQTRAEQLKATGRAVQIKNIRMETFSREPVVLMEYTCNSDPDPVVGKQVRLESFSYFFYRNGQLAELRVWAPKGADNVDQWHRISRSFRWR